MPIYEYQCNACQRRFSFLYGVTADSRNPSCPRCQSHELTRLFSRFATIRSTEAYLENLADPSKIGDLEDPKAVARWAKELGGALGPEMGMDADGFMDEMMTAAEGGDVPGGEDDFSPPTSSTSAESADDL